MDRKDWLAPFLAAARQAQLDLAKHLAAERAAELNTQVVELIKQFKRSLDALKTQHEEALSLRACTQVVAQLKR